MTTYRTGNPIGSTDPKDLYDNAENTDVFVNSLEREYWDDRFGRNRKTIYGMEQDFQQFLINSGYVNIGDYVAGLEITERNQIFWKDGELYRAGASLELPYTTTGDWEVEGSLFVAVGDQSLRQDLGDIRKGSSILGRGVLSIDNIDDLLSLTEDQRKVDLRYIVKRYHSDIDAGGGEFYWDEHNLSEEDMGVIFKPYGYDGAGRFVRVTGRIIDVCSFGAYPNYDFYSSTGNDSTDSIQRAINYASSLGNNRTGGNPEVIFPSGSYKVASIVINRTPELSHGLTLKGEGRFASIIYFDNRSTESAITVKIEGLDIIDLGLIGWENGNIGIPYGKPDGLVASNPSRWCDIDILFSRCYIHGWDTFLKINGRGFTFDSCTLGSFNYAIDIHVTPDLKPHSDDINSLSQSTTTSLRNYAIRNCRFDGGGAILTVSGEGDMIHHINNIQITGNSISGTSNLIFCEDIPNTLVGLALTGNTAIASFSTYPIRAYNIDGLIYSGNDLSNNYNYHRIPSSNAQAAQGVIYTQKDASNISINGSIIRNMRIAIINSRGNASNITIQGCSFHEAYSFGRESSSYLVYANEDLHTVSITGNVFTSTFEGVVKYTNKPPVNNSSYFEGNIAPWEWE